MFKLVLVVMVQLRLDVKHMFLKEVHLVEMEVVEEVLSSLQQTHYLLY